MSARLNCRLLGAGAAALFVLSVPSISLAAPEGAGDVPYCSATITDHCMQRGGGHEAMMGGHHRGHHRDRHHGGRHHHRHHGHHKGHMDHGKGK